MLSRNVILLWLVLLLGSATGLGHERQGRYRGPDLHDDRPCDGILPTTGHWYHLSVVLDEGRFVHGHTAPRRDLFSLHGCRALAPRRRALERGKLGKHPLHNSSLLSGAPGCLSSLLLLLELQLLYGSSKSLIRFALSCGGAPLHLLGNLRYSGGQ